MEATERPAEHKLKIAHDVINSMSGALADIAKKLGVTGDDPQFLILRIERLQRIETLAREMLDSDWQSERCVDRMRALAKELR